MKENEEEVEHGERAVAEEGNVVCFGKYQGLIIGLQRKEAFYLLRRAKIPNKNGRRSEHRLATI